MKKHIQSILIIYIVLSAVKMVFSRSTPFWDSYHFILDHLVFIIMLLFIKDYLYSSLEILIVLGLIVYKIELIIFNVALAFTTKEDYDKLSTDYDYAMIFTGSIWLILMVCLIVKKYLK